MNADPIRSDISMVEMVETVEIVGKYNAVGIDAIDVIEEMERVAPSKVTKNLPGLNLKPGAQRAVWEEAFANYARAEEVAADQVHHRRARQSTADALKDHITCALLLADRALTPREIHAAAERYGMTITRQRLGTTLRRWLSDAPFVAETGPDEWEIDPESFFRVDKTAYLLTVLRSGAKFKDVGRDYWTLDPKPGRLWGSAHPKAKLDSIMVAMLRRAYRHHPGRGTVKALAEAAGVTPATMSRILSGKSWKRLE